MILRFLDRLVYYRVNPSQFFLVELYLIARLNPQGLINIYV